MVEQVEFQVEFQVVVLAGGKGSRMTELTAGRAKCLLPIGQFPMLYYPLQLLRRSGFKEAIVIVSESIKNDVLITMDKIDIGIKMDLVGIPGGEDLGTADVLRLIHEKLYTDFVVVSCDLLTDINLSGMLDSYRTHSASITALLLQVPTLPDKFVTPGPKSKQKPETDLIGVDNETDRLVFLASASDFEESINISKKLYRKHTDFNIHSKLLDAHLYIIRKWILDYLVFDKSISTIKGELLPYIVKKQLSPPSNPKEMDKNTSIVALDTKKDIFQFAVDKPLDNLIRSMSAFNDHSTDLNVAYNGDSIRCYAYTESKSFGLRANNAQMYSLANSVIFGKSSLIGIPANQMPVEFPSAVVKCTQLEKCLIGDNAVIHEKTSLKFSNIGANSIIEPKTRLSNCVVMDNVTIKEGCVISNCILCNGSIIQEGSELKDCIVGSHHTVPAGSRNSHEVLTDIDNLMEI
ncbi:translation initiation factor eIF-2B subunit gamma [Athalia rosae]|uniref:translation initiation factor eIF-2B subunit gamma n=1 Tax=Athalia rosae TaxID=37344 RepID=UPI0020331F26|nr:translation initiation factor eIF-2B subunit gamma [Athalia rosae]